MEPCPVHSDLDKLMNDTELQIRRLIARASRLDGKLPFPRLYFVWRVREALAPLAEYARNATEGTLVCMDTMQKPENGCCPVHGGDNCLRPSHRARLDKRLESLEIFVESLKQGLASLK